MPTLLPTLDDKCALITGGSKGLGKALAVELAQKKARLALVARDEKDLIKTKTELEQKFKIKVNYYAGDVSDPKQVKKIIRQVMDDLGQIDILINNAAIWWQGDLEQHSNTKLQELFQINTLGYIYTIKYVLAHMRRQRSGQILNIISIAGVDYEPDWAPYTATKHAVKAFTESIRKKCAQDNIKIMAIYPPGMDTQIFKSAGFDYGKADWMAKKEDIAKIAVFMLSQPDDIVLNHVQVRKLGYN